MTHCELWGFEKNIGRHNAVQIPPSNNETENDAAFVDPFDVVGYPGNGICDAGVYSEGTEEGARIFYTGFLGAEEHGEADYAEERHADVAEATTFCSVSDEADCYCLRRVSMVHWQVISRENGRALGEKHTKIAAAAYGGTVRSCALVVLYPSSDMIVGRNREKA